MAVLRCLTTSSTCFPQEVLFVVNVVRFPLHCLGGVYSYVLAVRLCKPLQIYPKKVKKCDRYPQSGNEVLSISS